MVIKKNVARIIFCILLILLFLSAAKSHGRQYRLERELAGYWTVSFTSDNAPWVERFWFRQRVVYWSLASFIALSMIIWRFKKKVTVNWKQWMLFALLTLIRSMIAAFMITGAISMIRLFWKLARNIPAPSPDWISHAVWGSLGWWLATILLLILLLMSHRFLMLETDNTGA
jgi:hypothetical protein